MSESRVLELRVEVEDGKAPWTSGPTGRVLVETQHLAGGAVTGLANNSNK